MSACRMGMKEDKLEIMKILQVERGKHLSIKVVFS
jgi:hypothetical protein